MAIREGHPGLALAGNPDAVHGWHLSERPRRYDGQTLSPAQCMGTDLKSVPGGH